MIILPILFFLAGLMAIAAGLSGALIVIEIIKEAKLIDLADILLGTFLTILSLAIGFATIHLTIDLILGVK